MSGNDNQYNTRQSLLLRLKDNQDEASWEEFVATYQNYILSIIRNLKVDNHDAEDLLQSILLKLWKTLPTFEYNPGKGQFRYWLGRVTKNDVFKFFHKKNRRKESFSEEEEQKELRKAAEAKLEEAFKHRKEKEKAKKREEERLAAQMQALTTAHLILSEE